MRTSACSREVVPLLAQAHSISYPAALEQVICARLDVLDPLDPPYASAPSAC